MGVDTLALAMADDSQLRQRHHQGVESLLRQRHQHQDDALLTLPKDRMHATRSTTSKEIDGQKLSQLGEDPLFQTSNCSPLVVNHFSNIPSQTGVQE